MQERAQKIRECSLCSWLNEGRGLAREEFFTANVDAEEATGSERVQLYVDRMNVLQQIYTIWLTTTKTHEAYFHPIVEELPW